MSALEVYEKISDSETTKTISRFKLDKADAIGLPTGLGLAGGGLATLIMNMNTHDPFTLLMSMAAVAGVLGYGSSKANTHQIFRLHLFQNLSTLESTAYFTPGFGSVRRTRKEKRLVIVKNVPARNSPDSKVTLTLVTNKQGVWLEESVKKSPKQSWDKVLESVIKVHRLESIDALASVTVPELTKDGQKVSFKDKIGNLLNEVGLLKECQEKDCATNCNHLF